MSDAGYELQDAGYKIQIQDAGYKIQDAGCRHAHLPSVFYNLRFRFATYNLNLSALGTCILNLVSCVTT